MIVVGTLAGMYLARGPRQEQHHIDRKSMGES
jgi:hypothetical protein